MPTTGPEPITGLVHVAAGVILNDRGQVLLARRPAHKHQGGLWEFPGGKVDAGETVAQALSRELKEELDITVEQAEPFLVIRHDYPDKAVQLDVWLVRKFSGEARGVEGQALVWAALEELSGYDFPRANLPIIEALNTSLVGH